MSVDPSGNPPEGLSGATEEQGCSGLGLASQREMIRAEAERRGWDVEWVTDEGVSGGTLARPGILADEVRARVAADCAASASYRALADRLNTEGVPTATESGRWHPASVRNVVRSVALDAEATAARKVAACDIYTRSNASASPAGPVRAAAPSCPRSVTTRATPSSAPGASPLDRQNAAAGTVAAHTFRVVWEPETSLWGVEHADRDDVYTQGRTVDEARRHAVECLALVDDVDESEVGPVRFVIDGPVNRP